MSVGAQKVHEMIFEKKWQPRALGGERAMGASLFESCVTKSVISYVGGGAMGVALGLLFGSTSQQVDLNASTKEQFIQSWKASWQSAKHMARSFAVVGLVFAGSECLVEKARGKSDHVNGLVGGCTAGAILAAQGGVQAMVTGCLGFMVFSAIIDAVMHPKDARLSYMDHIPEPRRFRRKSKLEILEYPTEEDIPMPIHPRFRQPEAEPEAT